MFSSITPESWNRIRRQASSTTAPRVDCHNQSPRSDSFDSGSRGSPEEPSWCDCLQHVGPGLCAFGCDGCLFRCQSCTPLLCVVATLLAPRQRCSSARGGAALGAHGADE